VAYALFRQLCGGGGWVQSAIGQWVVDLGSQFKGQGPFVLRETLQGLKAALSNSQCTTTNRSTIRPTGLMTSYM
jgi:hypothetical protein